MLRAGHGLARQATRSVCGRAGFSSEAPGTAVGINLFKGEADPALLPNSDYPEWLSQLAEPQPVLSQLRKRDVDELDMEEQCRLLKLETRESIRDRNFSKAKNK